MADPFLGEIRQVGFNFAPQNWALCNGQLLSIQQNTALFSLLGTNFGGDGRSTFALPNLQGQVALGMGQGAGLSSYSIGETVGSATVTLTVAQLGAHAHNAVADSGRANASQNTPVSGAWAKPATGDTPFSPSTPNVTLAANSTTPTGGGVPHNNLMPFLVVNFIIAMVGIFPIRS
jgi:microcystin-dependent protein